MKIVICFLTVIIYQVDLSNLFIKQLIYQGQFLNFFFILIIQSFPVLYQRNSIGEMVLPLFNVFKVTAERVEHILLQKQQVIILMKSF